MKIKTLLILMMLGKAAIAQVPTDGLVTIYSFNGNANDNSGNGNNGTVYGATLTNDRFGNENSAYSFDGIDDYIEIGATDSLELNTFTISVWINEQGEHFGGAGIVVGKATGDAGEIGYRISMNNTDNKGYFVVSTMGSVTSTTGFVTSADTFTNNQWSHIIAIRTNDSLIIYKNGKLEGITTGITATINTDNSFLIGKVDAAGDYFFNGFIDDVRIYKRALDSTEIKALYHESTCFVIVTDTAHVTVYDTAYTTVYDTTYVTEYDTNYVTVYDTTHLTIHDTTYITISDTNYVTVYDTAYISVTDTLIIDVTLTGIAPPNNVNTLRVYPNPAKDIIYIDNGDYPTMTSYSVKIVNHIGQEVFTSAINQQSFDIDISLFGSTGLYYIQIIDSNNAIIDTRKIILE